MKTIIQITSGNGPIECEYFVGKTFELMVKQFQKLGFNYEILEEEIQENSSLSSKIIFKTDADESILNSWKGTIQWISKSKFRPNEKRKNWFVGVFEIEGFNEVKLDLNKIEFQTMRSSGPGGQNVNKVNSAVRAVLRGMNLSILAMDSRSQQENKKLAIERLKLKILEMNSEKDSHQKKSFWKNSNELERGNPVQIFKE